MSRKYFKITKCPDPALATANRIIVSDRDGKLFFIFINHEINIHDANKIRMIVKFMDSQIFIVFMKPLPFYPLLYSGFSDKSIINITKNNGTSSIHSVILSPKLQPSYLGLTLVDRLWLEIPLDEQVRVPLS